MTAPTLVRRAGAHGPRQQWRQPDPEPEVEQAVAPRSRRVWFEIPDGFMASISLVPYVEAPAPSEPEADD